ncbi:MAG TPA: hypothetical protein PK536_09925 [Ignavibacteria bacterium]|nr:hypothetical protein [Bacteroidota bacterium]HRI85748.1 hypothetical protein [Ignavibacteria bacterium]HRJ98145.1 hypothetical protein [Ignavibacteria bacterium]
MKTSLTLFIISMLIMAVNVFSQQDSLKIQKKQELENLFKEKVKTNLNVDQFTADKLVESYKDNNLQMRTLRKEIKETYKSIESDPDAADMSSKLDKVIELEKKSVEQKEKFYNELKTFLTPQQIAKSFFMKKKFNKELRKELDKRGKKRKDIGD